MIIVSDQNNSRIAEVEDNCIVLPGTSEVVGVVLGNHIYGSNGQLKGKIIHHTYYNLYGEIMALEKSRVGSMALANRIEIRKKAWNLVHSIKEYNSNWIEPKAVWAERTLDRELVR